VAAALRTVAPQPAGVFSGPFPPAAVLRRVVQQRRDRLVFAAAVVDDDRRDAHQVADIGRARDLAGVSDVDGVGVNQRLVEASRQWRHGEVLPGVLWIRIRGWTRPRRCTPRSTRSASATIGTSTPPSSPPRTRRHTGIRSPARSARTSSYATRKGTGTIWSSSRSASASI